MKISPKNLYKVVLFRCVFALCSFFSVQSIAAQVIVEMELDTANILVGQQVQLKTTVSSESNKYVKFPVFEKGKEITPGVEVVKQSKIDTTYLNDNQRRLLQCNYTITAFDSALYNIPPMEVSIDDSVYKATSSVGLKVDYVPVDTTQVSQFLGPHAVVPEVFIWRNHLTILSLVGWLLILLLFVCAVKLTRRKPLTTKKVIKPQVPPFKQASAKLSSLTPLDTTDNADKVKAYFIDLTDLLRVYLQRRYKIQAMEKTTVEILTALQGEVGAQELENLKLVFETADLVKFAKFLPSGFEMSRCKTATEKFLTATVDDTMEHPQPIVETIILNDGMQRKYRRLLWASVVFLVVGGTLYMCYVTHSILSNFF